MKGKHGRSSIFESFSKSFVEKNKVEKFVEKHRFGELAGDDSDSDDDYDPTLIDKSPTTRRKIKENKQKKEI